MADYNGITIDITENGYCVTVTGSKMYNEIGKKFVFKSCKDMRDWLKENLSATGEVERFSDALDNEEDKSYTYSQNFNSQNQTMPIV